MPEQALATSPVAAPVAPDPVPPSAVAVLSVDAEGRQIVSISVKHAYRISPSGACRLAEAPEPLLFTREGTGPDDLGISRV